MSLLATIMRMAHADLLERSRRFSALVMLAASLYAGYGFLPPNHAAYATLRIGAHRGIYNSAWVGAAIALLSAAFVGLAGFYLIKNAIEGDRQTRVGHIIAATPVSNLAYILSKVCSNFMVLAVVALVVAVSAGVTQFVRAEDTVLHAAGLFAPYLFLTLPALFFVAAVAAACECTPGLRGGGGNVAYFFMWSLGMAATGTVLRGSGVDVIGFGTVLPSMQDACGQAFADCVRDQAAMSLGLNFNRNGVWNLTTFVWEGIPWTWAIAARRGVWLAAGLGVAWCASRWFDRFGVEAVARQAAPARPTSEETRTRRDSYRPTAPGTAAQRILSASHLLGLLSAEVRIMFAGASRGWYLALGAMWIAAAVVPVDVARLRILPLLWMWPVLLWSGMGSREHRFGTDQILFSAPHPLRLQVPAIWLSGVTVAVLTGAVVGARLLLTGDLAALAAWAVGACFIPALALCLGVWTGSSRAFEGVYTALWYAGPLQPVAPIDFMGASTAAVHAGTPIVCAAVTAGLLALSFLGRQRQLRT